jgi:pimeloyl-ACP methyl ester carboxylesterase
MSTHVDGGSSLPAPDTGYEGGMTFPFRMETPDEAIFDLRERLRRVRWPADVAGGGDEDGLDEAFLRELVQYWRNQYDWYANERALNRLPQVRLQLGGVRIHAVHVRGRGRRPLPLLLSHGWPSSFAEFAGIVGPLTDPQAHGGHADDAFDVVVPSLPGYGFSDALPKGSTRQVTALWIKLMRALGYDRFGAHGGDIGAFITNRLAIEYPDRLIGVHTGFPAEPPPIVEVTPTEEERRFLDQRRDNRESGGAYAHVQRTRPLTLAYGLSDSPVGLAAWILDKWRDWTDCKGDLRSRFSFDQLLTVVNLYWLTGTIGTSFRFYREWGLGSDPGLIERHYPDSPPGADDHPLPLDTRIDVPAAVALFKARFPEQYIARAYTDLRRLTYMPRGGHFPALEEPQLLVDDLREFFRPLRIATR